MRLPLFLLVVWLAGGCATPIRDVGSRVKKKPALELSTQVRLFTPSSEPTMLYGPATDDSGGRTRAIELILARMGRAAVPWDSRLAAVAEDIAAFVSPEPIAYGVVEFALHHHGIVEPTPHLLIILTQRSDDDALAKAVADRLQEVVGAGKYQRLGIGIAQREGNERAVVAALQVSYLNLEPVPRSVPQGAQVQLRGNVHAPYAEPVVFVTRDNGNVLEAAVSRRGKRGFSADVSCDGDVIRLEVSAAADAGATVLANFPVYCGREPPRQYEAQAVVGDLADVDARELRLVGLINAERLKAGLSALLVDTDVAAVARSYSEEMATTGKVVHVSHLSGSADDRLKRAGIVRPLVQENLARSATVDEAHRSLMNSPGHRANILSARATHVGVGVAPSRDGAAEDLLVTELFTLSPPRLDLAEAQQQLGMRLRKARKLRADSDLDRIAQNGARAISERGTDEAKLLQDPRALQAVAGRYKGIRAMVVTVGDLSQIGPERIPADGAISHLGVGVAQGTHPDLGPNAIFVVLLFGAS